MFDGVRKYSLNFNQPEDKQYEGEKLDHRGDYARGDW